MFYLTHFFKIFSIAPFKTAAFIVFSLALLLTAYFSQTINQFFERQLSQREKPHFYALVENYSNYDGIIPQIKMLSGVDSIKFENHDEIQQLLKQSASEIGVEQSMLEEVLGGQFIGLKINFYPEVSKEKIEEAKQQIKDIFGAENTTLTPTKMPESSNLQGYMNMFGAQIILALMLIIWTFILLSFAEAARRQAYIIEQYQRRKKVCFKLVMTGLIFCTSIVILPSIYFFVPSIPELIIVLVFFMFGSSLFLRQWKWQEH